MKNLEKEIRIELEEMPFDRNRCHATGFAVYKNGEFWNEFEDEYGEIFLAR